MSVEEGESVAITRLGARGDGVTEDGLHVPYALAGERVRIARDERHARILAIETASPQRIAPFCRYFGSCGGCSVQHLEAGAYSAWKSGIVSQALRTARIDAPPIQPLLDAHGAGRRRLTLHVRDRKSVV